MNLYYLADIEKPEFNTGLFSVLSYYINNNPNKQISVKEIVDLNEFNNIENSEDSYVLVSISFFSEFWKLEQILKRLRMTFVNKKYNLLVGGASMIHFQYNDLKKHYPEIDLLIEGKGEILLEKFLNKEIPPGFYKDNFEKVNPYLLLDFFSERLKNDSIALSFNGVKCFWKKCDFCHHFDEDGYNNSSEEVFKQIRYYYRKFGIKDFLFTDNFLLPHLLFDLLDKLLAEGIDDIQFSGLGLHVMVNFKKLEEYVPKFKRNIFASDMGWGIEFLDDEVLSMYHKGTTVEMILNHADFMNSIGLSYRAFMLLGLPNVTDKQIKNAYINTEKYFNRANALDTCGISWFALDSNMSNMFDNPEKWNIRLKNQIAMNYQFEVEEPVLTRVYNFDVYDLDLKKWVSREEYYKKFKDLENLLRTRA